MNHEQELESQVHSPCHMLPLSELKINVLIDTFASDSLGNLA